MTTKQLDRFMRKVDIIPGGCWEWRAGKDPNGYGRFNIDNTPRLAHTLSYEHQEGGVPYPLELDHLCKNPGCCNPKHLEAVTHLVNVRRGRGGSHWREKTHCKYGHEYSVGNTYVSKSGSRFCRTCHNTRSRGERVLHVAVKV